MDYNIIIDDRGQDTSALEKISPFLTACMTSLVFVSATAIFLIGSKTAQKSQKRRRAYLQNCLANDCRIRCDQTDPLHNYNVIVRFKKPDNHIIFFGGNQNGKG